MIVMGMFLKFLPNNADPGSPWFQVYKHSLWSPIFFQVRDQISEVDFTLPNTKTFLLILPQIPFPANSFPTDVPQRGDEFFVEQQKGDSHGSW